MNRRLLLPILGMLLGLGLGARPAAAASDVTSFDASSAGGNGNGAQGSWHVQLSPTGTNTWSVVIHANSGVVGGNIPAGHAQAVNQVAISFTGGSVTNASGGTSGNNWIPLGAGNLVTFEGGPVLMDDGSNSFQATLTTSGHPLNVAASLQDAYGDQWNGGASIVPEGSSALLLCPAVLALLGIVGVRRRWLDGASPPPGDEISSA